MNQKRILPVLIAAVALFMPCYAVCAGQDASKAVRSYGTIVYEEDGSKAKICGDDIMLLGEEVSSIPEKVFEPSLFSTPGNPFRAILMTRVYEEEAESENEIEDQLDCELTDKTGKGENIENNGTAVEDGKNIDDGFGMENETNVESKMETEDKTYPEDRTSAGDIVDSRLAEGQSDKGEEGQADDSISSNTMGITE